VTPRKNPPTPPRIAAQNRFILKTRKPTKAERISATTKLMIGAARPAFLESYNPSNKPMREQRSIIKRNVIPEARKTTSATKNL